MFVETIEAASVALNTIELLDKSIPTFKKIFSRLKDSDLKIAIFGAGGTGKTTLGKILSGQYKLAGLYDESISIEQYKLDSNVFGSVIVVPGQERREDTWDDLLRVIAGGKVRLVIHLVSWGYHSFGTAWTGSYKQHGLYQNGMTVDEFVEKYLEKCRERDIEVLRKIEPYLSIADQKKTVMITLVTKQDLWWNHRHELSNHYRNGEYETLVQSIRNKRGSNKFIHEYLSASLVLENFVSGAKELLVPTTEGYDQRIKSANFVNLLRTIEKLFNISLNIERE
jgi:hypothetical protein